MLTGNEIARQVAANKIIISDFNEKRLNPNSYNLRLGHELKCYDNQVELNSKCPRPPGYSWIIIDSGFVLQPGTLYLGSTMECAGSDWYVPILEGRSSVARLGITVHASAGFGDLGFKWNWTLEITVVNPVRIYRGMEICQIAFFEPVGQIGKLYRGKYVNQSGPVASKGIN